MVRSIVSSLAGERLGVRGTRRLYLDHQWTQRSKFSSMDLVSHYGCVNAVEFSKEGEWLISAGDDRRILFWNVNQAVDGKGFQSVMAAEHRSNIFCLGFDSKTKRIYSGGNDEQVIVHDIASGQPLDYFLHEEPVYGLSVHPENPDLFSTACSDGRVLLFDMRQPPSADPLMVAGFSHAFHAVQFNPVEPRLLVAANQKLGISLWDIRKPGSVVLKYESRSSMYVRFNDAGTKLVGLRRRLPPILFNIDSPVHVCEFDNPGYYNSCTMKSCTFGGPNDEFIFSGSDDFNLYMWRVPGAGEETCWKDSAHLVLRGHRSIVNQVRYNPQQRLLASSGVEKVVKVWSTFPLEKADQERREEERPVYTHDDYIGLVLRSDPIIASNVSSQSTTENPRMMAFFDSLVQREIEGWDSVEDSEESASASAASDSGSENSERGFSRFSRRSSHLGTRRRKLMERISFSIADDLIREDRTVADARNSVDLVVENTSTDTSFQDSSTLDTSAETVSGVCPSRNRITELIARKRTQLVKVAKRRGRKMRCLDQEVVNRTLLQAKQIVRLSSSERSTSELSSDQGSEGEAELNLDSRKDTVKSSESKVKKSDIAGSSKKSLEEINLLREESVVNRTIESNGESRESSSNGSREEEASLSLPGTSARVKNTFIRSLREKRLRIQQGLEDSEED